MVEAELQVGPMSILQQALLNHMQIMVSCRNNKVLIAHLKAFDRHMNLVLENVKEIWSDTSKGKKRPVAKERFIPKMFLRGDSVIMVLKNPKANLQ